MEKSNETENQGYHIEHNYGHCKTNLSMIFFILNLLAFFFHQIFELTDRLYQDWRGKFSSRKEYWNQLRCTFRILIFKSWEQMLVYLVDPPPLEPPSFSMIFHLSSKPNSTDCTAGDAEVRPAIHPQSN